MNSQGSITTNDLNAYPNESSINGNKLNSRIREYFSICVPFDKSYAPHANGDEDATRTFLILLLNMS